MITRDPVLERVREANPSPLGTPEPDFILTDHALRSRIEGRTGMMDTDLQRAPEGHKEEPNRTHGWPVTRRGWVIATIAAAAMVLIALPAAIIATTNGSSTDQPGTAVVETVQTPADIVEAYFAAWNAGDLATAATFLDPGLTMNDRPVGSTWNSLMAYTASFDGGHEVSCRSSSGELLCDWKWVTSWIEAQDEPNTGGRDMHVGVSNGLLTEVPYPDFDLFEFPLMEYADSVDRTGRRSACVDDGASFVGVNGMVWNASCGAFLASHVDGFIDSLSG